MRVTAAAILALSLVATSVFAADTTAPLAPGKPAGVKQAQNKDNTVLYVVGGVAIIAGIALLASSGSGGNNSVSGGAPSGSSGTP